MMVRILRPRHAMGWSPALGLFILWALASFWGVDSSRVLRRSDNLHPTDGTSSLTETRRLAQKTGTSSVLVVRVSAAGGAEQTKSSLDSIQSVIFDRSPSVQSQFRDCSNGVLTITNGGLIEVTLDYTVQGRTIDSDDKMKNDLIGLVEAQLNTVLPGEFQHVLFCLPPGTTNLGAIDWVAFAVYEGFAAYFNDGHCEGVITVMHEMGHNMGLGHACQFSDGTGTPGEYGDKIGVMGIDDFQTRKCYNGAMSNLLGWYDAKYTTTLDGAPDENILKCLFGSAEYSLQPNADEYQLAYRIGNIVVSFNRKTGPNGQTTECADQVAIHESPILSLEGLDNSSNRLTCLSAGQSYEGDGYVIHVGDIDTTQEPGCARVGIVVQPTQAPTAAPTMVLPPDATPSPTQFPTTQANRVDFYVENFANADAITITLIGSCGDVIGDTVVNPGEGGSGYFLTSLEDQWRFVISDAGGNDGAKYSVSFRGVPQVALTTMTQAEECHIVGGDSPRCDGDLCPGQTAAPSAASVAPVTPEPMPTSTSSPMPTPSIPPDQPTASDPTTSPDQQSTPTPSSMPDQPTISAPTGASEQTPEPTSSTSVMTPVPTMLTGPTLPPVETVAPVNPAGTCDVQVRVEGCPALIQSQSPVPGCDCYNYCNGVFLGCCAFDVFCEVYCPSDNFVGGCVLEDDATLAPTEATIENPQPRPTMGPLPPTGDKPAPPSYPPLPPSGDIMEGTCLRRQRTDECTSLIAFQSPLNNCACYNYCDGVFIGCCEFDSSCRISECPSGNLVAGCRLDGREDVEGSNTGEQGVVIPVSPSFLETSIWDIWGDRTGGRRRRLRDLFPPMGRIGRREDEQIDDHFEA